MSFSFNYFFLAISYVENGQLDEALTCYLEADKLKPNNEKITFNLGNLVRNMILYVNLIDYH